MKFKTGKISIRNNAIDVVKRNKFLGIIIDDKLNWTEHIQYIKNMIFKSIGILIKIRPYLDKVTLRIYILLLCTHTSYIVLRFVETHVTHILIQSLKSKRNVFELPLSHITWSLPNLYLKTLLIKINIYKCHISLF